MIHCRKVFRSTIGLIVFALFCTTYLARATAIETTAAASTEAAVKAITQSGPVLQVEIWPGISLYDPFLAFDQSQPPSATGCIGFDPVYSPSSLSPSTCPAGFYLPSIPVTLPFVVNFPNFYPLPMASLFPYLMPPPTNATGLPILSTTPEVNAVSSDYSVTDSTTEPSPAASDFASRKRRWSLVECDDTASNLPAKVVTPVLKCRYCEAIVACHAALRLHTQQAHPDKAIACMYCNKGFPSRKDLLAHAREVHPDRALLCRSCRQGFPTKDALSAHYQEFHPYEDPARSSELNLKRPCSSDRFTCHYCGRDCLSIADRASHTRQFHPKYAFVCRYCLRGFPSKPHLRGHTRQVHPLQAFGCSICDETFPNEAVRNAHDRDVHNVGR